MADEAVPTGYTPATFHELWSPIASPDNHRIDVAALDRHMGPMRWA